MRLWSVKFRKWHESCKLTLASKYWNVFFSSGRIFFWIFYALHIQISVVLHIHDVDVLCIKDYIVLKIIFVRRKETWPTIKRCVELVQTVQSDLTEQSWVVMTKYYKNPSIFGTTPLHSISSLCTTGIRCLQWWWWWRKVGKLQKRISM